MDYSKRHKLVVGAVVLAIVLGIIGYFARPLLSQQHIDTSKYQAVVMISGQVYFGKLQNTGGTYLTLLEAHTVQGQTSTTENNEQKIEQNQTSIIKVSQQVYGPQDTIALNSDQVLFWQNLRDDSKVVSAIKSAK